MARKIRLGLQVADARHRQLWVFSVEKLGSCELAIFSMNPIAAENQP
jgi:hypothetical protein